MFWTGHLQTPHVARSENKYIPLQQEVSYQGVPVVMGEERANCSATNANEIGPTSGATEGFLNRRIWYKKFFETDFLLFFSLVFILGGRGRLRACGTQG